MYAIRFAVTASDAQTPRPLGMIAAFTRFYGAIALNTRNICGIAHLIGCTNTIITLTAMIFAILQIIAFTVAICISRITLAF
jgi:hypothetical protein